MGQCISKNQEGTSKFDDDQIAIKQTIPIQNKQYQSKLLNPNLNNIVIAEEESCLNQSSIYSIYSGLDDQMLNKSSLINAFQKARPLGCGVTQRNILKFVNVSNGKKLHSHALKYDCGSKLHEVSLCNDQLNEYDEWQLQALHDKIIEDQNVVVIQHKLTKHILRSSACHLNKSKLQQVSCADSATDINDDDYWRIESISDSKKLKINSLIRIKHMSTNGYLSVTKNKATLKGHNEVCIQQSMGFDVWVVEEVK